MSDHRRPLNSGANHATRTDHVPVTANPVPVEFERFLRSGPVPPTPGAGETPRHDLITDTGLSDFTGLFRDEPPIREARSVPPAQPASPHPSPGTTKTKLPPKPHRWRRILAWILIGLLMYATALVAVFALSVNKVAAMPANQIADTPGDVYLLVGSDGREKLTKKQRKELHTGYVEGQRTDSIMLLQVPLFGQPTLISIPRDSWVPIPGRSANKINAAFALGGPPLLIQAVEQSTGVHVDHYVEIGMGGIAEITDALGGVTLCPTKKYNDDKSALHVNAGCQVMDGKTSLAYVRMRYSDPKGDEGRQERQQEYIRAVVAKTANPLTWLNPIKMFNVDHTAGSALTVDDGSGLIAESRLAIAMTMLSAGWGESTSVPIETDSYWVGGQQAVKWNTPEALALFKSIGAR
ncbi:MAG: LCP family protein [Candidatus Nanopelagicales bacterium]|nr:LCP family protein [Candidatus Nanopelagicales bacterium]MDZ4249416.1 LCP family protein [Candidatus Nanopelagicales bacterium]